MLSCGFSQSLNIYHFLPLFGFCVMNTCVTQLVQFDKKSPFPNSLKMLREVETAVYSQSTLRTCHFKDITVPLSRSGVGMINVWQDLKAVTYDLYQIATDLLSDGDHAQWAVWKHTIDIGEVSGMRAFNEVWTANWWKRQQDELGPEANILAVILYVDETHVTYNGRNMHPIYMSLANLHLSFR